MFDVRIRRGGVKYRTLLPVLTLFFVFKELKTLKTKLLILITVIIISFWNNCRVKTKVGQKWNIERKAFFPKS